MKQFQLNIEIISGEPFISIKDLVETLESSISKKGTKFDLALFNLASQLKDIRLKAIEKPQGEENENV